MGRKASPITPDPISADPNLGLTSRQVEARKTAGLTNRSAKNILPSDARLILGHCATFFNLVFTVLAVLLMLCGSTIIKLSFLVVVIINTCLGCIQSIRAKRALEKLTLVAQQTLPTIRDGKCENIPSDLLVRDDIVEFSAGCQVCADGVLCTGQLFVNEALVTGEEDPIAKNPGDTLLSGSFVVAGTGRVQLTKVGDEAFASRLADEARKNPRVKRSEMMDALDKLIRIIGILLIPIGAILFSHEYFVLGRGLRVGMESTAAALVGMIPEGLYLLTSIALAVSSIRLARRQVLVRDMSCIESLARVDMLCVDKTGTITEPSLEVDEIIPLDGDPTEALTAMYGSRSPENDTAQALFEKFRGESAWECTHHIPFTSERKWSGFAFRDRGVYLVGAPDILLDGGLQEKTDPYAQQGFRALLVARYNGQLQDALDAQLVTPMALVLLRSRIRPDARSTFAYFRQQGVAIKVISGDDPRTVSAIAQRAGIEEAENWVDATTLLTDEDLFAAAESYTVFGRVTPHQKRSLLRALKKAGHTVAMTGDGVNDVLAMREADCAVAMASGAQAAGQVAHLVLLHSDFAAMPHIVAEGRRVINNIERSAALFLVKNIFSLGITLLTLLTGQPYPMEPQHMTVISGLTIGFPSFMLTLEPNFQRVKGRFLPSVLRRALPGGLVNVLCVFILELFAGSWLPSRALSTLCTVILATTGLSVLFGMCRPYTKYRGFIWFGAAVGLMGCFTLLGGIFEFAFTAASLTFLPALLMGVPAIYFCASRLFPRSKR